MPAISTSPARARNKGNRSLAASSYQYPTASTSNTAVDVLPLIPRQSILLGMYSITNMLAWVLTWIYVRELEVDPADGSTAFNALRFEEVFQIYRLLHWEHVQFQWQNKSSAFNSVWDFVRGRLTPVEKRSFFINWIWETKDTKWAN